MSYEAGKWLEVARNFRENLQSRITVPFAKHLVIPRLGELYWLDSTTAWQNHKRTIRSWTLHRHSGDVPHDKALCRITIPKRDRKKPNDLRVALTLRSFTEACMHREIEILRPFVCVDPTLYGTQMGCDMEAAAIAGQVLARVINAGKL